MTRVIAMFGLAGQVAVLAIQLHCPMAGLSGHIDTEVTAVAHSHGHDHGVAAIPDSTAPADEQPVKSLDDCVMASGCMASTAVLARISDAGAPALAMFDTPTTIVAIESAFRQHTTPPPRHPVQVA